MRQQESEARESGAPEKGHPAPARTCGAPGPGRTAGSAGDATEKTEKTVAPMVGPAYMGGEFNLVP